MVLKQDPEGFMSKHSLDIELKGDKDMLEEIKAAIEKAADSHNGQKDSAYTRWKLT